MQYTHLPPITIRWFQLIQIFCKLLKCQQIFSKSQYTISYITNVHVLLKCPYYSKYAFSRNICHWISASDLDPNSKPELTLYIYSYEYKKTYACNILATNKTANAIINWLLSIDFCTTHRVTWLPISQKSHRQTEMGIQKKYVKHAPEGYAYPVLTSKIGFIEKTIWYFRYCIDCYIPECLAA